MRKSEALLVVGILLLGSLAQGAETRIVRVASPDGMKLRAAPSITAQVIKAIDVGDAVAVLKTVSVSDSLGKERRWAYVKAERCAKGNDCANTGPGWVPDEDLAYESRFERLSKWIKSRIKAGVGDYWFILDIDNDAEFSHQFEPCVDCGETGECPEGSRKEGGQCISEGHLYRFKDFIWAKEVNEYFFLNDKGDMCSVYSSEEDGTYCAQAL